MAEPDHCSCFGKEMGPYRKVMVPLDYDQSSQKPTVALHYHIFGSTTSKSKVIMLQGFTAISSFYQSQAEFLCSKGDAEVCVLDNRGCGLSDSPKGPYRLKTMAQDVHAVLDHLLWSRDDSNGISVHIVGLSMGGMIAQRAVHISPERFNSASLLATHSGRGWKSKVPQLSLVSDLIKLVLAKGGRKKTQVIVKQNLSKSYRARSYDGHGDSIAFDKEGNKLNFSTMEEYAVWRWLRRLKSSRPQPQDGIDGQLAAVRDHCMSKQEMEVLKQSDVRFVVVTGSHDRVLRSEAAVDLAKDLGVEPHIFERVGHALTDEIEDEVNTILYENIFHDSSPRQQSEQQGNSISDT